MISVATVLLPTVLFTIFSLLSIPVFRFIRKRSQHETLFSLVWILIVFATVGFSIVDLGLKYYGQPKAFLNVTMVDNASAPIASAFLVDAVSVYMSIILVIVGFVSCLYAIFYLGTAEKLAARYYALLFIIMGSVLAVIFSGDLLTLFIFWEASTVGSCFLIAYRKNREASEAALKFIVMIIIASGFIVYGLSMVYGLTGSLNFWTVREALVSLENRHLLIVAFVFIAAGYAIESAIVPFHMWLPDAYSAAPAPSSAFLSAIIDQASYYVLLRVLVYILTPTLVLNWTVMLAVLSALTMVVGNLLALAQRNIKRLIAYVCIADVGYNLIAITSVMPIGLTGNLYFFLVGGITTALAFMVVGIFNNMGIHNLDDLTGFGRKMPLTSFALLVSILSFSGIPPLAGFMAKFLVFTAAIRAEMVWLAIIGVLTSVLQTAYFLRLANYMYSKSYTQTSRIKEPTKLLIPIYILLIAILVLGLYPSIALDLMGPAAGQMRFLTP